MIPSTSSLQSSPSSSDSTSCRRPHSVVFQRQFSCPPRVSPFISYISLCQVLCRSRILSPRGTHRQTLRRRRRLRRLRPNATSRGQGIRRPPWDPLRTYPRSPWRSCSRRGYASVRRLQLTRRRRRFLSLGPRPRRLRAVLDGGHGGGESALRTAGGIVTPTGTIPNGHGVGRAPFPRVDALCGWGRSWAV